MFGRIGSAAIALGLIVTSLSALAQERIEPALESQPTEVLEHPPRAGTKPPERPERPGVAIESPPPEGGGERQESDDQDEPEDASPAPPAAVQEAVQDEDDADGRNARTDKAEQREQADLIAQQTMAEAAFKMLQLTKAQIVLGTVGAVLLLAALFYAARQTKAATQAANAALEANKLSRDIFVAEQRAWLPIRQQDLKISAPLEWERDGARLNVQVNVRNIGRSPAHAVGFLVEIQLNGITSPFANVARRARAAAIRHSHSVIFPGDDPHRFGYSTILPTKVLDEHVQYVSSKVKQRMSWKELPLYIRVICCIDYGIISGERRHTITIADVVRVKDGGILPVCYAAGNIAAEELRIAIQQTIAD